MKIIETTNVNAVIVETDESEYNQYIRYGSDNWMVTMGESDEPVYDCENLETAYQQYISKPSWQVIDPFDPNNEGRN